MTPPSPLRPEEKLSADEHLFEHTGIRIMRAANGDIMFCDPGAVTGVRDHFIVTTDAIQCMATGGKAMLWDRLVEYVYKHEEVRDDKPLTFSYNPLLPS